MGSFDTYRLRLNSAGTSQSDAHRKATIDAINANFSQTLGFAKVFVDGVERDAVLQYGKTQDDRVILFRPNTAVKRGSIIEVGEDRFWLVTDTEDNDLYPKATVLKCNHTIKWDNHQSLAVVQAKVRAYGMEKDQMLDLPRGEYSLLLPYNNETKLIKENVRFIINGGSYSVIGLDNITHIFDDEGVITVHIKDDLNRTSDDLVSGIAQQKQSGGGWDKW